MDPTTEPARKLTLVCSAHGVTTIHLRAVEGMGIILTCGCQYHQEDGELRYAGNHIEDDFSLVSEEEHKAMLGNSAI